MSFTLPFIYFILFIDDDLHLIRRDFRLKCACMVYARYPLLCSFRQNHFFKSIFRRSYFYLCISFMFLSFLCLVQPNHCRSFEQFYKRNIILLFQITPVHRHHTTQRTQTNNGVPDPLMCLLQQDLLSITIYFYPFFIITQCSCYFHNFPDINSLDTFLYSK